MSSSSSSFVAGVSDKYLKLEVSFSLFVDTNDDDPSFSAMLLRGLPRCAHFSFVLLLLQSCLHKDGWTYSTSFWCTSRLNFPSYNMSPILRTYTHDYNYTPNNYLIWTHATHYLKTTNLTKCVRTNNPNK